MPTKIISIENARKHYTKQEKTARMAAEARLTRPNARLSPPDYIKSDELAQKYWRQTVKNLRGLKILDNADAEALGTYCSIMARLEVMRKKLAEDGFYDSELIKRIEAHERLQLQYATKLGLTPEARLRIAKREAEQQELDEADELYGTA